MADKLNDQMAGMGLNSPKPNENNPRQLNPEDLALMAQFFHELKVTVPKDGKLSEMKKFSGKRSETRGFINQLTLRHMTAPNSFANEFQKIADFATNLEGDALAWFNPLFEQRDKNGYFQTYETLIRQFREHFGSVDEQAEAAHKLSKLSQKNMSVATYAAKFQQIAADLTAWGDRALMYQFQCGLQSDVSRMLINYPEQEKLDELIKLAIRCDNRLIEEKARNRNQLPPFYVPPAAQQPSTDGPVPMEIDETRRGPLTAEEREYRMRKGLCIICGKAGHLKANCPRKRQAAATTSTRPQESATPTNAEKEGKGNGQ